MEILRQALAPLGKEYTDTLCGGLLGGWCDRYENKGKDSGAFSSGGFVGYPYILLNYKKDVLRDLYTMAHEGGHSMHSYYSSRSNPFMQYDYTIFEAEVASTFNEQLVFQYLLDKAETQEMKAYLLANRASDILATLYRQTMFAEFEMNIGKLAQEGTALTPDVLNAEYRRLNRLYFGENIVLDDEIDMEWMRIPHFYYNYYVFQYATGYAAAIALSRRILREGESAVKDYIGFLSGGCSKSPIDLLKGAGVDMSTTKPVEEALALFGELIDEMEELMQE